MKAEKISWMPVRGSADVSDTLIQFIGENRGRAKKEPDSDLPEDRVPSCVIRSNVIFESGFISGKIRIEKPENKVQFRFGRDGGGTVNVGINVGDFPYGIALLESGNSRTLSGAGKDSTLPTNKDIEFKITVKGSEIELRINDVPIVSAQAKIQRSPLEIGILGQGKSEIKNLEILTTKPTVFVVMQFTEEYTALFKEVISPVCQEYGYDVIRADNIYNNGLIIEDITQSIRSASLVIADITPNNPNVYYEVGYAHGIEKPTILLSDRAREKLPFDISGFRLLFYDNTIGGKSAVDASLRRHLDALRASKF